MVRRLITKCAVVGALLAPAAAFGDAQTQSPSDALTLSQPVKLDDAPAPRKPLMGLLDKAGLASTLDSLNINVYGYVEGSYTYNTETPAHKFIPARVFDIYNNRGELNQADISVERTVDVTKKKWDVGFKGELVWGSDASLIHSNGEFDYYNSPQDPQNQFDLEQAYVTFAVPVGNGLLIKAGKFVTLLGYETINPTINPTTNPLYSHSFEFGFAIPFTQTGVLGTYVLNDQWTVTAGITRGWEQFTKDSNSAIDFTGEVTYAMNKKTNLILNVVTGPERPKNDGAYRTVIDGILTYAIDDNTSLALNPDFGFEDGAVTSGKTAYWYSIAGYLSHKLNDKFTVNVRGEWFRDDGGSRFGAGSGADAYEATLGVTIHPFSDALGSNLAIRPEIRYDYSNRAVFGGPNNSSHSQATAAIEAYFTF